MARHSSIRKVLTTRYVSKLILHYLKFSTFEKGRELGQKYVPQLFLGLLQGTRRLAIGQFCSLSLVTVPEIFTKVNPLSPLSDQSQYSPNSVNTESRGKAMGIIEMITLESIL